MYGAVFAEVAASDTNNIAAWLGWDIQGSGGANAKHHNHEARFQRSSHCSLMFYGGAGIER
jgi:hypothetical protein